MGLVMLGRGVQYTVFVDEKAASSTVTKIPNSYEEALAVVTGWDDLARFTKEQLAAQAHASVKNTLWAARYMRNMLKAHASLGPHLGNPSIALDGSYLQDRVTVLHDKLMNCTPAEAKALFEQYAAGILEEWSYGFSDLVFNPTVNSGVTDDGVVILMDFSEITTVKSKVLRTVIGKRWQKSWSYTHDIAAPFRDSYCTIMKQTLTKEHLDTYWKRNM